MYLKISARKKIKALLGCYLLWVIFKQGMQKRKKYQKKVSKNIKPAIAPLCHKAVTQRPWYGD